jgi:hypothetical protein
MDMAANGSRRGAWPGKAAHGRDGILKIILKIAKAGRAIIR